MTVGMSSATATGYLNATFNATAYSVAEVWVQLHTADPGAAGTANVATETDRVQLSMGSVSTGGGFASISNDAELVWNDVAGAEDFTHLSLHSAATDGTFLGSGPMTANAVSIGDDFVIPVGDIDVTLPIATT